MKKILIFILFLLNFNIYAQDKEIICAEDNCVPNFQPEEQFEKVYYSAIDAGENNEEFISVDSEINASPRSLRMSVNQNDNYTDVEANINLSPKTDEFDAGEFIFLSDFLKKLNLVLDGYQGSFGKPATQICAENYLNGNYGVIAREEFNAKRISNSTIPTNRCVYSDVDYLQKNEFQCDEGYQEIAYDNPTITVRRLKGKAKCLGVGFQDLCLSKSVEVTCTWRLKYLEPSNIAGQFSTHSDEQEIKKFVMSEKEWLEKKNKGMAPYLCQYLTKRDEDPEPIEKLTNGYFYRDMSGWNAYNNAKWVNSKAKLDDGPLINMTYPTTPGDGLTAQVYYGGFSSSRLRKTVTTPRIDFDTDSKLESFSGLYSSIYIRFSGYIRPRYSETYSFYAYSDDGVRVWINGQLVIDRWYGQSPNWGSPGKIFLEAGELYSIKVEYYEGSGKNRIRLDWASSSQGRQIIPQSQLYTSYRKDFLALNGSWTDEIALHLTTHYLNTLNLTLNYEYLVKDSNRVSCRQNGQTLYCKFYIPPHENSTNKLLSNVLKVKVFDQVGNYNIYDIQLNYTVYDQNLTTNTSGSDFCGDMSAVSRNKNLIYGQISDTNSTTQYCYEGSCSSSWEGAIKRKFPQYTNAYGFDRVSTYSCKTQYSSYSFWTNSSSYYRYYSRYGARVKGRWFEGYLNIARESIPYIEKDIATEEEKMYRVTGTYFEPSEEKAKSQIKVTVYDDVSNTEIYTDTWSPMYNEATELIDFVFKATSYRTRFKFEAVYANQPATYSSSVYLDNISVKEISLNAGPSVPPTEPLTANVQGQDGNGYYALYGEPTYSRTTPGYDAQNAELVDGSRWSLQYTGINQSCPVFFEKIATNYLASHIGYDDNDERCDDVVLEQDPEGILLWSNIGYERLPEFGTETVACSTGSCPVSSTIQNLKTSLDQISTTSGINGTNQGRGLVFLYDVENLITSAKVGVAGKAGSNDLPEIITDKACVKIQDFNSEGPESEYASNPVVDFKLYKWQALKVNESQDLGVNPEDNGNRVYIYKKMDSSSRYFLSKEML